MGPRLCHEVDHVHCLCQEEHQGVWYDWQAWVKMRASLPMWKGAKKLQKRNCKRKLQCENCKKETAKEEVMDCLEHAQARHFCCDWVLAHTWIATNAGWQFLLHLDAGHAQWIDTPICHKAGDIPPSDPLWYSSINTKTKPSSCFLLENQTCLDTHNHARILLLLLLLLVRWCMRSI